MKRRRRRKAVKRTQLAHSDPPFSFSKTRMGTALKDSFWSAGSVETDLVLQSSQISPVNPSYEAAFFLLAGLVFQLLFWVGFR